MDQRSHIKKTDVIKRSILLNGHKTSVSLEKSFWQGLHQIADRKHAKIALLVEQIDRDRTTSKAIFACLRSANLMQALPKYVFQRHARLVSIEQD